MNAVKHYILDIYNVEKAGDGRVRVRLKYDSWGCISTDEYLFRESEWENVKAKGWFDR